jgi:RimJ/RimL family protein N-acetyltransferase
MAAATGRWAHPRVDGDRATLRPVVTDEPEQDERLVLSIVDRATGEDSGGVVLGEYDAERESAALRITLRGPTGDGHDILDEVVRRMVDHGLRTLGLARITVDVPDRDRHTVEASRLEPDYPIVTERLLLRPLDAETDVAAMHAYRSREDVCEYEPYVPGALEEMAERFRNPERIRSVIDAEGQKLYLAIERRDTGAMVGDLMLLWHSVADGHAEVGYVLHPDHGGRGFATEATAALIDLAFDGGLPVRRVTVRTDVLNERSAALSRRLGMRHEATLVESEWFKGGWSSLLEFAVLDHEWRARR